MGGSRKMKLLRKYLIRVDDVCEGIDKKKFSRLYSIFLKHNIKATFGIIPNNKDLSLISPHAPSKREYIKIINDIINDGMFLAQHEYNHILNKNKSEFRGLSYKEQFSKINAGKGLIKRKFGVDLRVFIAPAHTYDRNTLRVLKKLCFDINYDGFSIYPYISEDLINLPCNFWIGFNNFPVGINTICIHPNFMKEIDFKKTESFIIENKSYIVDLDYVRNISLGKRKIIDLISIIFVIPKLKAYMDWLLKK
jgi:hypothetical protein